MDKKLRIPNSYSIRVRDHLENPKILALLDELEVPVEYQLELLETLDAMIQSVSMQIIEAKSRLTKSELQDA